MEKEHDAVDVRGTLVLTFIFLTWFGLLWVISMIMLTQVWYVK